MFWVIILVCIITFVVIKVEDEKTLVGLLFSAPVVLIIAIAVIDYFYFYTPTYLQKQKNIIENFESYSVVDRGIVEPKTKHIFAYNKKVIEARTKKKSVASHIFGFAWAIDSDVTEYELIEVEE